ncbi:MAG: hypothetical protein K8S54_11645 [Spirochaetia bacterium]|nr:hypothetical protein [Spirochaetia bacterium]
MKKRLLIASTYSIFFFCTYMACNFLGIYGITVADSVFSLVGTLLLTILTYIPRAIFTVKKPYSGFFYYGYVIPISIVFISSLVYRTPLALPLIVIFILGLTGYTAINAPFSSTLVYGIAMVSASAVTLLMSGFLDVDRAESIAPLIPTGLFVIAFARIAGRIQGLRGLVERERDAVIQQKSLLEKQYQLLDQERSKSESLLLNILPATIASELKENGTISPVLFDSTTVMFTDFKGFTEIAERLTPRELVKELDSCFSYFDSQMDRYGLEKLKTIGDSYMCAGGIPISNRTHAIDTVLAAIEIQAFMQQTREIRSMQGFPYWELRIGINTGPLVAGVIGAKKFSYDVWSDTVNTASRMESSGDAGRINISRATYEEVHEFFECEYRGRIAAKNKGEIEMYFVNGIKPGLSKHGEARVPNERFAEMYRTVREGRLALIN